nr:unnamed protein product [Spirometra erinaceieuropaei]
MSANPAGQIKCLKGLHTFGNILLIVAGICELIIGAIIMIWLSKYLYALGPAYTTIPSILLALGFVCIILPLLGLYGGARENVCMLKTYTALVIILFFVEIIIAIFTSVESNRIESGVEMSETHCKQHALDYPINKIPETCCSQSPCNITNAFKRGCAKELSGYLEHQMLTMSITAFVSSSGFGAIHEIAMILPTD